MDIEPVTLHGEFVRLEPMNREHTAELCEAGLDPVLWRWTMNEIATADDMAQYVEQALAEQGRGISLPFVTRDVASDKIVGSTRFGNVTPEHRRVEIGWTWVSPAFQRTYVNTEAKLLMLTHAFEVWECVRVELKTDVLNEKSHNAMLRIGAKREGVLRRHVITDKGRFRDNVFFSIINEEWTETKKALVAKLRRV
ncbi:MAG: GNAT family N-acetyltransferase [Blastocatellia bacterium]|nr:GNAT family N-acetyltransferase [Blastocatellia bacterium]